MTKLAVALFWIYEIAASLLVLGAGAWMLAQI